MLLICLVTFTIRRTVLELQVGLEPLCIVGKVASLTDKHVRQSHTTRVIIAVGACGQSLQLCRSKDFRDLLLNSNPAAAADSIHLEHKGS